jgi:L-malate glycosyltransferase
VILEAMAAGRPVVTTDAGGPGEYVRNGRTGFVVPVEDDAAFSERLARLLDDPDLQDRMGAAGREVAVGEHAYARLVDGFVNAYERALSS